jgi:hypothetical protein
MKLLMLLTLAWAFCGCSLTPNVNTRKPGQKWYYYGELLSVYRDETRGSPAGLVWLDEVQFTRVNPNEFQKTIRSLLTQGYRKIGFISVRSQYFVDPYSARKLAADKGARMVVGCWFSAPNNKANAEMVEYWYQLLDKASPPAPVPVPSALPRIRSRYHSY